MAVLQISNQYKYVGRGPFDAKTLVKTYSELTSKSTWTVLNDSGKEVNVAYNGMIVAVWLDKDNPDRNGIYYLHDPLVTSAVKSPDVTQDSNWSKISNSVDLSPIEERLEALETEEKVHTYGYKSLFPSNSEAKQNHLYVAANEGRTYVFFDNDYHVVGSSEPDIIYGGSAN
jgi:hypothetical protein